MNVQTMATADDEQPAAVRCVLPVDTSEVVKLLEVPYLKDEDTVAFLRTHGRVLFLVRGPPGSGKHPVLEEFKKLYPGSKDYCAEMFFREDVSRDWNTNSRKEAHQLCQKKIDEFMAQDSPIIININTNIQVWEVNRYVDMAARHNYTVILVNMPHHFLLNTETLLQTNKDKPYGLSERYLSERLKIWEEVHPYATGWSPRPRDAAELLRRFHQMREALEKADPTMAPKDAVNTMVTPFALARICLFGRVKADEDYCGSEKVKKAYGRKDTLAVFGYAVAKGFVFAVVKLSEAQTTLTDVLERIGDGSNGEVDADDLNRLREANVTVDDWKEVRTEEDLANFMKADVEHNLTIKVGSKINLTDLDPSTITVMPLGACDGTDFSYSQAVSSPWALLSSKLRTWISAEKLSDHRTSIAGVDVYGSPAAADDACLLVDGATVEVDAVFTGLYYPHTTATSGLTRRKPSYSPGRPPGTSRVLPQGLQRCWRVMAARSNSWGDERKEGATSGQTRKGDTMRSWREPGHEGTAYTWKEPTSGAWRKSD